MKKAAILLTTVAIATIFLTSCGSAVDSFESQIKKGNYNKAIQIYNEDIVGNIKSENEAERFLQDYIQESKNKYAKGSISDQGFTDVFMVVEKVNNELSILKSIEEVDRQFEKLSYSKECYKNGVDYMESGKIDDALASFINVDSDDIENYDKAAGKINQILGEIITNADENLKNGDYDKAIERVLQAKYAAGYVEELEKYLSRLYTEKFESDVNKAYDSGDYIGVVREVIEAKKNDYITVTSQTNQIISSSLEKYKDEVLKQAQGAFGEEKDYAAAIRVLQVAASDIDNVNDKSIRVLANEFSNAIDKYIEYKPISLTTLEYTQKTKYFGLGGADEKDLKDVNGEQYDETTVMYPTGGWLSLEYARTEDEGYINYNLNREYSKFTGMLYRPYNSLSSNKPWDTPTCVKIYGDDVLLYEAPNITKDTYDTMEFEVDVTGVRNLKIVMMGTWTSATGWGGLYSYHPKVCLTNGMLQK